MTDIEDSIKQEQQQTVTVTITAATPPLASPILNPIEQPPVTISTPLLNIDEVRNETKSGTSSLPTKSGTSSLPTGTRTREESETELKIKYDLDIMMHNRKKLMESETTPTSLTAPSSPAFPRPLSPLPVEPSYESQGVKFFLPSRYHSFTSLGKGSFGTVM
jgi:hypothetical protein